MQTKHDSVKTNTMSDTITCVCIISNEVIATRILITLVMVALLLTLRDLTTQNTSGNSDEFITFVECNFLS